MRSNKRSLLAAGVVVTVCTAVTGLVMANGGPFVVKYPSGDPAAKGTLARLGTDLKPTKEERLKVVKEDLKVSFGLAEDGWYKTDQPRIIVAAIYTIENPTDEEIQVDFGFPILRGIYQRMGMGPFPDVNVTLGTPSDVPGGTPRPDYISADMITNSIIYGIIRQNAREAVDKAIAADAELAKLTKAVKDAKDGDAAAKKAVAAYATSKLKWNERDAALLAEYAGLDLGKEVGYPRDRDRNDRWNWRAGEEGQKLVNGNLGALSAIGEQKATQFLAQLATAFDSKAGQTYEAIFAAWGGDVKEQSVDLKSGRVRPRELTLSKEEVAALGKDGGGWRENATAAVGDPTVYARVDYFDDKAPLTEAQKASCKTILKNLPVVFTFAPMNLLHYQVKFPAKSTRILTVAYSQYGYKDTAEPASYQFAYVIHPASLWKEFGPINLDVTVPEGMKLASSAAVQKASKDDGPAANANAAPVRARIEPADVYRGTLKDKTGEIFLAVPLKDWEAFVAKKTPAKGETPSIKSGKGGMVSPSAEPPSPLPPAPKVITKESN